MVTRPPRGRRRGAAKKRAPRLKLRKDEKTPTVPGIPPGHGQRSPRANEVADLKAQGLSPRRTPKLPTWKGDPANAVVAEPRKIKKWGAA